MTILETGQIGFSCHGDSISGNTLARIFTATGKLTCGDLSRGTIASVKVEGKNDTVVFSSCDSYRLIEVTVAMPNVGEWVAYPIGKELVKASTFVRGKGVPSFIVDDGRVVVTGEKGSVNIDTHFTGEFPNISMLFDYNGNDVIFNPAGVSANGNMLGETMSLMADIVSSNRSDKVGLVDIVRANKRIHLEAKCQGVDIRAVVMPLRK